MQVGAERMDVYLPLLQGKRVAVVTNQTGLVGDTHLVDTLLSSGVQVVKVFSPEHGFRGTADAGAQVKDSKDARTGLPLVSLYGKNKKPSAAQLSDVDLLIFDIQDVGVRFYTYISTMHYCMEAVAEHDKQMIVLDRPNPNGFYVDGPILEPANQSFVGLHPIPIVHGLTVGELAKMINGEGWLADAVQCDLTVVTCAVYTHDAYYDLPVKPSPNLPNMTSVYLYPSLGLFEGTDVSVGRGTDMPFQCIGHPELGLGNFEFTPRSTAGATKPPHMDQTCRGFDLRHFGSFYFRDTKALYLDWLIGAYEARADKGTFFNAFFIKLAGTGSLRKQIELGLSAAQIRASWQEDLTTYKELRQRYLLYP